MVSHEENLRFIDWFLGPSPYTSYPHLNDEIDCNYAQPPEEYHGSDVDNDAIIAQTLQDDFLQLEIAENNEYSHHPDPYDQRPIGNWNHSSEWVENGVDPDTSDTDEYVYSRDSTDLYDLDNEVGKRLNHLISIPHVPKINGEIPSEDEAVSDHQRLLNRLESCGFTEVKVQGDGNCQFRALSDQLYNTPEHHKQVRRKIVNQLKSCRESYEGYVPMDYSEYLKKMSRSGEWGDHVTLQAAADAYGVKISVITSFKDTCYIEILPKSLDYKRVISLSFWAEVHYNSIYVERDTSSSPDLYRKKKWWHFGN